MPPTFFPTPADFRRWLTRNHAKLDELWVGYYKKATGKPTITWQESVEEALCFGWIDGIRRRVDDESYTNRFTPRRKGSNWSVTNIRTAERLIAEGRMCPAGLKTFEARKTDKSEVHSREKLPEKLSRKYETAFRANKAAWAHFTTRPPGYRRLAIGWVMSAKKEETRERRLATLIEDSACGRPIKPLA